MPILFLGAVIFLVYWFIKKRKSQKNTSFSHKDPTLQRLVESYGEVNGYKIFDKTISFGFDQNMVVYAWGRPAHTTQKATLSKVSERWYFGEYQTNRGTTKYKTYVDFENGIVVGFGDITK